MQVADMMRQIVITTTADRSLAQAQQRLQEHRVRHLPVVAQTPLIGLLTDRDVRQASASRLPQLAAATRATSSAPSMLAADGQDLHPQVWTLEHIRLQQTAAGCAAGGRRSTRSPQDLAAATWRVDTQNECL